MLKKDLDLKTDEDLMVLYQDGNIAAFDILYARYSARVYGFLRKKLNGGKETQDLTQDAFFKLHRSRHQYNSTLPFSPWVFSITRSVLLDYLKKDEKIDVVEPELLEDMLSKNQLAPEQDLASKEDLLKGLPKYQKQVVSMRVYDESTFEEIAQKLSTSPDNARQLFSRSIKTLRGIWERE